MSHRVDELDAEHFTSAAEMMADDLDAGDCAFVQLEPGDATVYRVVVVKTRREYLVASNFGKLYGWAGGAVHWDYAASHYVDDGLEWTARVIARLLTALHEELVRRGG